MLLVRGKPSPVLSVLGEVNFLGRPEGGDLLLVHVVKVLLVRLDREESILHSALVILAQKFWLPFYKMSRLPSFSTVSSGVTQLLQKVLVPRAQPTLYNGTSYWNGKADLSNVGVANVETLYVTNLNASNISANIGATIGNETTGVAIAGQGSYPVEGSTITSECNITGFGIRVLGQIGCNHQVISNDVFVGTNSGLQAVSVTDSVFVGSDTAVAVSNIRGTVAIGQNAQYGGSGSNNVYIGSNATTFANAGSGNVFLGAGVGATETTTSNTLLVGNPSSVLLRGDISRQWLGIGRTPVLPLDVSGSTLIRGSLGVNLAAAPGVEFDVSGRAHIRGDVIIDGDLTVSGGPIGSDVCTGQVVIGVGATTSNYQSLISRIGGMQVCNGYLQINRTEYPFEYHLDVSGTSRITGSSLIGGVTLSGTNVTTPGTISGVFINGPTTSNVIGGITLSRGELYDVSYINISGVIGIGGSNASGGSIRLNNNLGTMVAELNAINASAGNLILKNSNGTTTLTISGSTGQISNSSDYDSSIGGVTLGPNGAISGYGAVPIGSVTMYAGPSNIIAAAPPVNWLFCQGQAVSRTTYSQLWAKLSNTFGNGNGSTTFNLPDLRNRFPIGVGAGRPMNTLSGEETHILTINEMPAHTHTYQFPGIAPTSGLVGPAPGTFTNNGAPQQTTSTGGGLAHNNMPPYIAIEFIIRAL